MKMRYNPYWDIKDKEPNQKIVDMDYISTFMVCHLEIQQKFNGLLKKVMFQSESRYKNTNLNEIVK